MDSSLQSYLLQKGYSKAKLHLTKTNHFEIKATINGVKGRFILDTGASSSCVGFEGITTFHLKVKDSDVLAAGAGATHMKTKKSSRNKIKIGKWRHDRLALILFDLKHINAALTNHNAKPVDGIIGADILKKGKAVIDYEKKYLYLKL